MMFRHKVAVLLDGGFALHQLARSRQGNGWGLPSPEEVLSLARACVAQGEDLFRIYYYDCEPYRGTPVLPISGRERSFGDSATFIERSEFYNRLAQENGVAFRAGQLKFRGWNLKPLALEELGHHTRPLTDHDFQPNLQQKGVDIKIGLDISWLASKRIVDRIILFTGDTDFVPAMKFARREGVQVVLAGLHDQVSAELKKHSDEFRLVTPAK